MKNKINKWRSLVHTVITLELDVDKWKQNVVVVSLKCLNFVNYIICIKITTIIGIYIYIYIKKNYNNF